MTSSLASTFIDTPPPAHLIDKVSNARQVHTSQGPRNWASMSIGDIDVIAIMRAMNVQNGISKVIVHVLFWTVPSMDVV